MNYYPNLTTDYIGASGNHNITDYIDLTSNNLNTNIDITSNTLYDLIDYNITNGINAVDSYYKLMIEKKIIPFNYFGTIYNVPHTYISNSNQSPFSEIRFYSSNVINYPTYDPPNAPNYRVKIGNDGKLYVYYNFDPAISATLLSGWVDLNQEIGKQQADGLNQGAAIAGLEGQIAVLNVVDAELSSEIVNLYSLVSGNAGGSLAGAPYNVPNVQNGLITSTQIENIRNSLSANLTATQNALTNMGGATAGFAFIYGVYQSLKNNDYINSILGGLRSNINSNITNGYLANVPILSNANYYTSNIFLRENLNNVNYYTCNLALYQGFINSNITNTQYIPSLKSLDYKLNTFNLFNYIPSSPPPIITGTGNTITSLNNGYAYVKYINNGTLQILQNTMCDILIVAAGGRGGTILNFGGAGGGGSGEVIYYPNFLLNTGTYNIQVGIDSATTSSRISKISLQGGSDIIFALGGGNGAGTRTLSTTSRQYPPKAYIIISNTTTTIFSGVNCYYKTFEITPSATTTYGYGTYEVYYTSQYSASTNNPALLFNWNTTETTGSAAFLTGNYSTTSGGLTSQGQNYYICNSAYRGDTIVIKTPVPIALTSFKLYQRTDSTFTDRRPKNFNIYGSNTGASGSWVLLLTTTNASYSSGVHNNTALSANTTPYVYHALAVNAIAGGTSSTLLNFAEWQLFGKEIIIAGATSGGSGGGGSMFNIQQSGALKGIPYSTLYSKTNNGNNGTFNSIGGSGGSALSTGRYTEVITGTNLEVALGGSGGTSSSTATTPTNYGDGGSGNGGLAYQGVIIIKVPFTDEKINFLGNIDYNKIENIEYNDVSKWELDRATGNITLKSGGYCSVGVLNPAEKLSVEGALIVMNQSAYYDHIKLSHDGTNAFLDIAGADNYFSIRIDYPPDYSSYPPGYYDIITILGNGSGFVGIQKINPTCELDVFGAIKASSSITAGGSITGTDGSLTSLNLNSGNITNAFDISCSSLNLNSGNITGVNQITASFLNGLLYLNTNSWHTSIDGRNRFYFANLGRSYFASANGYEFRSSTDTNIAVIDNAGNFTGTSFNGTINGNVNGTINGNRTIAGTITFSSTIYANGTDTIGTNYTAGSGGLITGTEYPVQSDVIGFCYWGGGLNSTVVAKNISGTSHLISLKGAYAIMAKGLISYSDRRIKKNEKDFLALPLIYHIKPRNYDYKENNANSFGFIAQEMEEVLPQLVITGKGDIINDEGKREEVEDFKSIDYNQLIALNTQAIKELMENQKKLYEMILEIKEAIKNIK